MAPTHLSVSVGHDPSDRQALFFRRPTGNVYCTSVDKCRYFPKDPRARIFVNVPAWPGHFDIEIEIDCIAAV
jgi:hypothetical protein